jgi:hypothetical protein
MRLIYRFLFLCAAVIVAAQITPTVAKESDPMSPDDVLNLCSSGKPEVEVIKEIRSRGVDFEMNVSVMQKLLQGGISPGIIQVILSVSPGPGEKSEAKPVVSYGPAVPGLHITSKPSGIQVIIDGRQAGITPFLSNKVTKGKHLIRLDHPLFISQEKQVDLTMENTIALDFVLQPREPLLKLNVSTENEETEYPWAWIARARKNCPSNPSLDLVPLTGTSENNSVIFVLSDESKQTFQSGGTACIEISFWRGRIRSDLPIQDLPPCTTQCLISEIEINGIQSIDLNVNLRVNKLDPLHPDIKLDSSTGSLIRTGNEAPPVDPELVKERLLQSLGSPPK